MVNVAGFGDTEEAGAGGVHVAKFKEKEGTQALTPSFLPSVRDLPA